MSFDPSLGANEFAKLSKFAFNSNEETCIEMFGAPPAATFRLWLGYCSRIGCIKPKTFLLGLHKLDNPTVFDVTMLVIDMKCKQDEEEWIVVCPINEA